MPVLEFTLSPKGAIVNVSSVHAVATSVGIAAYAASKGALSALTRNSALEFAAEGVRVNAVLPGAVDTAMLHSGLSRGHLEVLKRFFPLSSHPRDPTLKSLSAVSAKRP